ncbi:MAG TPA: type VI secretion system amidase effector protein Tae4 [Cellvibrio sp.]|nr:type VI secretion system amidase effector protein Tae4 [Cellvibrio sp.]
MSFFKTLWDKHPTNTDDDYPCKTKGKNNFHNQCAIRMGVCFERAGLKTSKLMIRKCWQHKAEDGHTLAAEEFANALQKVAISPKIQKPIKFKGSEGFSKIAGKKGIIFFKDYYGQNGQGDHIDLWNGTRLTRFSTVWDFMALNGGIYRKADVWFFPVAG